MMIFWNQELNFQSIKVETFPVEQSKTSDTADPLLIHKIEEKIEEEIKEKVFEENEATLIYIKQEEEFVASGYQIVQENGMIVQEICFLGINKIRRAE